MAEDSASKPRGLTLQLENPWKALAILLVATQLITLYILVAGNPLTGLAAAPKLGNGKVVMVVYEDFQCPFCGNFENDTYPQLKKEFIDTGKIEFQFKHFPLSSIHPNAEIGSEAAECARDQQKFEEFKVMLFQKQSDWSSQSDPTTKFGEYSTALGLDGAKLVACVKSGSKTAIVQKDYQEGVKLGVTGTPTFFINGKKVVGALPYAQFQQEIATASGGSVGGTKPTGPEPKVNLTIVNDSTCSTCDTAQTEALFKDRFFSNLNVKKIEFSSAEGKALQAQLKFNVLPAYIFDATVEKSANFSQVQPALQKTGIDYLVSPSAVGVGKIIKPIDVTGKHALGKDDAKVTIVEFSDFQCPFCEKFYSDTEKQLRAQYVDSGKVKFVFMQFPLTSIHPNAQPAAEASECAAEQGKFWEYHDKVFEEQSKLSPTQLPIWASELGLDMNQFNDCFNSGKTKSLVASDQQVGTDSGVNGTPAFYVNGMQLSGAQPLSAFEKIINAELAK